VKLRSLLREPLTHFFAMGFLLFAVYGYVDRGDTPASDEIVVDQARVEALGAQFAKTWQRPPTSTELQALVDSWVREEILYREGLALRLDQDDPVVRRRIAQKMDFITDSLVLPEPTEQELQDWLDRHPEDYRVPTEYSLLQMYFDPSRHGDRLAKDMAQALTALEAGQTDGVTGDSTLLPYRMGDATADQVGRVFGADFAAALAGLPVGRWVGPVESGYGMHLVYLEQVKPGRQPALDELRTSVERDLLRSRNEQANEAYYVLLREKYTVRYADNLKPAAGGPGS